jgi:hypothetical protein
MWHLHPTPTAGYLCMTHTWFQWQPAATLETATPSSSLARGHPIVQPPVVVKIHYPRSEGEALPRPPTEPASSYGGQLSSSACRYHDVFTPNHNYQSCLGDGSRCGNRFSCARSSSSTPPTAQMWLCPTISASGMHYSSVVAI